MVLKYWKLYFLCSCLYYPFFLSSYHLYFILSAFGFSFFQYFSFIPRLNGIYCFNLQLTNENRISVQKATLHNGNLLWPFVVTRISVLLFKAQSVPSTGNNQGLECVCPRDSFHRIHHEKKWVMICTVFRGWALHHSLRAGHLGLLTNIYLLAATHEYYRTFRSPSSASRMKMVPDGHYDSMTVSYFCRFPGVPRKACKHWHYQAGFGLKVTICRKNLMPLFADATR